MSDPKGVQIGTKVVTIGTITGWKFLESAELIASITEQLPELYVAMEAFRVKRIESGTRTYSKATALAMFSEQMTRITDEDWMRIGNELVLPGEPPSVQEQIAQVFPDALRKARPLVTRLLAVLAVPNTELEAAVSAGGEGLEGKITEWQNLLLFSGSVSNLIRLVAAAVEAFKAEAEADEEVKALVGKLGGLLSTANGAGQDATQGASTASGSQQNESLSSSAPASSDGTPAQPSTVTTGESSEPSTPASASAG